MPATNFTPIQLYRTNTASTTAPSAGNLNAGELAINYNDGGMILFAKNTTGTVIKLMNNPASLLYPTADGTANQAIITNGSGTLSFGSVALTGSSNTFTAAQTFRAANAIRSEAASTQDAIVIAGRAGGTSSYAATITPPTLAANITLTTPSQTATLGYLNVPQSGSAKTTAYTLATSDVGEFIEVGSGGSIEIPNSTFSAGDAVLVFNNTAAGITITCTITTAYIGGTDSDKATMTLATRGIASILFVSGTVCVVTGNVS